MQRGDGLNERIERELFDPYQLSRLTYASRVTDSNAFRLWPKPVDRDSIVRVAVSLRPKEINQKSLPYVSIGSDSHLRKQKITTLKKYRFFQNTCFRADSVLIEEKPRGLETNSTACLIMTRSLSIPSVKDNGSHIVGKITCSIHLLRDWQYINEGTVTGFSYFSVGIKRARRP